MLFLMAFFSPYNSMLSFFKEYPGKFEEIVPLKVVFVILTFQFVQNKDP